ncbi:hypothetical protein MRX96_007386 [Rhipicephalus microplus]
MVPSDRTYCFVIVDNFFSRMKVYVEALPRTPPRRKFSKSEWFVEAAFRSVLGEGGVRLRPRVRERRSLGLPLRDRRQD